LSRELYSETKVIFFDAIREPKMYPLCPVKMTSALALRLGQCHGNNVQDVFNHTMQQPNRCVAWKFPELPVVSAIDPHNRGILDVRAPATTSQLDLSLKQMAVAAGVVSRINPRYVRNGALRDIVHLPSKA
jgi:hypothetical protein